MIHIVQPARAVMENWPVMGRHHFRAHVSIDIPRLLDACVATVAGATTIARGPTSRRGSEPIPARQAVLPRPPISEKSVAAVG